MEETEKEDVTFPSVSSTMSVQIMLKMRCRNNSNTLMNMLLKLQSSVYRRWPHDQRLARTLEKNLKEAKKTTNEREFKVPRGMSSLKKGVVKAISVVNIVP